MRTMFIDVLPQLEKGADQVLYAWRFADTTTVLHAGIITLYCGLIYGKC